MGDSTRIKAIQGLRGIAVLLVILFHFDIALKFGYLGVDIFFVISGFVISRLIYLRLSLRTFSFRDFYYSRFYRLFPALGVSVLVSLIASAILTGPASFVPSWQTGISALFGVSNITAQLVSQDYFAPDSRGNALLHTWSLGVEEQFYLVFPALLFIVHRVRLSSAARTLSLVMIGSSISLGLFLISGSWQQVPILGAFIGYYSPLTRAWEFGLGAVAYFLTRVGRQPKLFTQRALSYSGGAAVLAGLFLDSGPQGSAVWFNYVFVTFGTAAMIYGHAWKSWPRAWLETRVLCWIGDRSYSLYLWHWPIAAISSMYLSLGLNAPTLALLLLMVAISELSYRFIENQRLRFPAVRRRGTNASLSLLVAASISSATFLLSNAIYPNIMSQNEQRLQLPMIYEWGCHDQLTVCGPNGQIEGFTQQTGAIYLVGDSNAAQHFPGLALASQKLGVPLYTLTASSCKGLAIDRRQFFNDTKTIQKCENFQSWIRQELLAAPPGIVAFGFSMEYVTDIEMEGYITVDELREDILAFKNLVESAGHQLALIEPIPFWTGKYQAYYPESWIPTKFSFDQQVGNFNWKDDLGPVESWGKSFLDINRIFKTHELLCKESSCRLFSIGKFWYRDDTHITVYASETMADDWLKFITSAFPRRDD